MSSIKNRVLKTQEVEWQKVNDLQPENLKIPYNYESIKHSIIKHGIAKAYDICEVDGQMFWLDGHTRTQILNELVSEGYKIPKKLTGNFIQVADKADAVALLFEVHNQRQNPMDRGVVIETLAEHKIEETFIAMETLNIAPDVAPNVDYSILDEDTEGFGDKIEGMTSGVKKAIQIEFEAEHYEEAQELVKFWREQKLYVGGFLIEKLKAEKEKI